MLLLICLLAYLIVTFSFFLVLLCFLIQLLCCCFCFAPTDFSTCFIYFCGPSTCPHDCYHSRHCSTAYKELEFPRRHGARLQMSLFSLSNEAQGSRQEKVQEKVFMSSGATPFIALLCLEKGWRGTSKERGEKETEGGRWNQT